MIIAFYSASNGMASLIQGINVAYDEREKRGFFRLKLVTFALTLFLMFGFILCNLVFNSLFMNNIDGVSFVVWCGVLL